MINGLTTEQDLISAEAAGRNLPEEKYIHMMARRTPEDYAAFCVRLPELPPEHLRLAETVNRRLMDELRAMREKYPLLNRNCPRHFCNRFDAAY